MTLVLSKYRHIQQSLACGAWEADVVSVGKESSRLFIGSSIGAIDHLLQTRPQIVIAPPKPHGTLNDYSKMIRPALNFLSESIKP